jgi:2-succinyl-5-enolpyruvyl-6-hydroxy-3-cyclohexene-1-carboxylate synthase
MGLGDVSLACAAALVDALAGGGVRQACVSPGSRSTPLALAIARDERITVHVHLDERSAGFFAVGLAKRTGIPVAVACTSGTGAAEQFPAVIEASQSRTPLVVLTADRPPRLRGTGANQTIDQVDLYGQYARAYLEPPPPASLADVDAWFDTGLRALVATRADPTGPVHVNCPFDEPLVPDGDALVSSRRSVAVAERGEDLDAIRAAVTAFLEAYAGRRGLITLGGLPSPKTLSLLSFGSLLGWPVLAEPVSGLRLDASEAGRALAAGGSLIGDPDWLAEHRPDVVLQVGAAPTSRATQALVATAGSLVVLDHDHLDPDVGKRAERRIALDPESFAALAWDEREHLALASADPAWREAWRTADLVARATVDRELDRWEEPFEGRIARDVASFMPHGSTLVIGSSTPVRDLDLFMAPRRPPRIWTAPDLLRVIGNRGASGIDGSVSTTLGVAVGATGVTVAVLGDLSFLYDAGTLLWSPRLSIDVVFVVLANGGGQIFSMLDQASLPEFQDLFLTPHPASIATVSEAARTGHELVERASDLTPALERAIRVGGVQVIEVAIDAERDRARRQALRSVVHDALAR